MKPFELEKEELFVEFRTSQNGLSQKEALKRLSEFGENKIKTQKRKNYLLQKRKKEMF